MLEGQTLSVFRISRVGNTTNDLIVNVAPEGTAVYGTSGDYTTSPPLGPITIPAGSASLDIAITTNLVSSFKSSDIQLRILPYPGAYLLGSNIVSTEPIYDTRSTDVVFDARALALTMNDTFGALTNVGTYAPYYFSAQEYAHDQGVGTIENSLFWKFNNYQKSFNLRAALANWYLDYWGTWGTVFGNETSFVLSLFALGEDKSVNFNANNNFSLGRNQLYLSKNSSGALKIYSSVAPSDDILLAEDLVSNFPFAFWTNATVKLISMQITNNRIYFWINGIPFGNHAQGTVFNFIHAFGGSGYRNPFLSGVGLDTYLEGSSTERKFSRRLKLGYGLIKYAPGTTFTPASFDS